jgi:membrane-associated phospholipid phosphatase
VGASYLLPLTFFTHPDTKRDVETLGAMWAEATLLNLGLNGTIKAAVLRTRPYVYDPDAPGEKKSSPNARLSFYSGHATSASMNSFFVARVFSDYLDDTEAEAAIWTGAVLYPAVAGFMRVATGHHFRSDVIIGYVIGAAIGYFVPELHRDRDGGGSLSPPASAGSLGIGVTVAF